jgi:phosphoadenosine phosphosulfate reductase
MPDLEALRAATRDCSPEEMLRLLLRDRFPGKTVVTASLREPSIVVLKMVADIDPATPVVFCRRGTPFPESAAYHDAIVALLGLTNLTVTAGHEPRARRGDYNHSERMLVEYENCPGACHELAHLNDTLAPFDCWVSAVYHADRPADSRPRVDVEGRIYRINALAGWSDEQIREFTARHELPLHARAYRRSMRIPPRENPTPVETYNV